MSLLSSIFGNDEDRHKNKKHRSSSLFDKKTVESLPKPTYHELPQSSSSAKVTSTAEAGESAASSTKTKKKRKHETENRGQRKGSKESHSGEATSTSNDKKDNEASSNKRRKSKTSQDVLEDKNEDEATTKKKAKDKQQKKKDDDSSSSDSSSDDDDSSSSSSGSDSDDAKDSHDGEDDGGNVKEESGEIKKNIDSNEKGDDRSEDDGSVSDEDDTERTVFVGNLPLTTTTRKSLKQLFEDCGAIENTRIRSVPVKGIKLPQQRAGDQNLMKKVCANTRQYDETLSSTVQGYVKFVNKDSVEKALGKNNTIVQLPTGGKIRIKVDTAEPTMDASRSVFCGNLPYSADEISLQDHFVDGCGFGKDDVVSVRVIRDKETFQCKGFGYVLLKERDMVSTALKLHGSVYKKKQIRVMVCGKRFKGRQDIKQRANKKASNKKSSPSSPSSQRQEQRKPETLSAGALRRILSKEQKQADSTNKRKRGGGKGGASSSTKAHKKASLSSSKSSKRAAADKKVEQRLKKIQKRISRGMGKTKKGH